MNTNELHNAQVKLASAQAQYEQLQEEERRLSDVRKKLATSKEQTRQAIDQLKIANEAAIRNRIEAENAAMILQAAEDEAKAARLNAEAAAKRAQAKEIAAALAEIEAAAEKADAMLLGYAEQLATISKLKRSVSQQLTRDFHGFHVQVPHPAMEAEIREASHKTSQLHMMNNAIDHAGTFDGTQARSGQYVAQARVIVAPYLTGTE
ncbi:hypothetical protein N825_23260 [Skermanella stibiiresistens SB22]|uniref:Uncharacterized protein n=1 Tax=Skermanella stibiiresistens SB22 TaxID=1385369 RepID=W9GW75_9PROT|nr:hypothetical protein [Skermanella stibiiresistens]EWY36906.1 hypothetical protein N825_23260 [Skermanella stibiiresistens SB22]